MSTIKTAIELEVKEPNLKGFRQQLKQLTLEAQQAVIQFGEFSPEAVKAAQRVAELRDRMEDFNDRVAAVNPDKFAQLNTVVSSVANGFQAAQGAMVLLGGTTESVEKTFVKLQAAMALSEGLEGLGKVQQQLRQIIASATTFQKVMAGTLGVIVLVVSNFERLVGLIPGLKTLGNFLTEIGFKISDFFGLGYREAAQYKAFKANNDLVIAEIEKRIAILGTQKNTELDIFDARKELARAELKDIEQQLALQVDMDEEQKQQLLLQQQKLNYSLQILEAERTRFIEDQNEAIKENDQKHKDELLKIEREQKNKIQDLDTKTFKSQQARRNSEHYNRLAQIQKDGNERIAQLDEQEKAELKQFETNEEQKLKIQKHYAKLREQVRLDELEKSNNEDIKYKFEEQELQNAANLAIYQEAVNASNALIGLTEQNTQWQLDKLDYRLQKELASIEEANKRGVISTEQAAKQKEEINLKYEQLKYESEKRSSAITKALGLAQIAADTAMALSAALRNTQSPTADNVATGGVAGAIKYIALAATILNNSKRAIDILRSGRLSAPVGGSVNIGMSPPQMVTGSSLNENAQGGKVYVLEGDIRRTQQRVGMNRGVSVVE